MAHRHRRVAADHPRRRKQHGQRDQKGKDAAQSHIPIIRRANKASKEASGVGRCRASPGCQSPPLQPLWNPESGDRGATVISTATEAGALSRRDRAGRDRLVILASSLGTVFEWYDFYLYGLLATIISAQFFSGVNETTGFIFALAAFAAGFAVRPFGALVFGRIGDLVGRKYTFLVTMGIMGLSTFLVGLLPSYAAIGVAAPLLLVTLRLLQGLALGGEYGGAATYVAEHAPEDKRGLYTSFIQTTATLGLFLALLVVIGTRSLIGEEAFAAWGWRLPFLLSILLLAVSLVDPAAACREPRLPANEGGGDDFEGAVAGSVRPVVEP